MESEKKEYSNEVIGFLLPRPSGCDGGLFNGYIAVDRALYDEVMVEEYLFNDDFPYLFVGNDWQPKDQEVTLNCTIEYPKDATLLCGSPSLDKKYLVLGFDTQHRGMTPSNYPRERVEREVREWVEQAKRLIEQINLHKKSEK